MATARYVCVDGQSYSPNHPIALKYLQNAKEWALKSPINPPPAGFKGVVYTQRPPKRSKGRIRQSSKPLLNKLEQEFYEKLKSVGTIDRIYPHGLNFMLCNGVRYLPDFVVSDSDGCLICYEVKGKWMQDDSVVKIKMAAKEWPDFCWYLTWKSNGKWEQQRILP